MIKLLKKVFYNLFGLNAYLRALNLGFNLAYGFGFLRDNYIYKYHYFVKKLVKKGDTVIDLGANLGFYSKIFSNLVGDSGKVYCIEPVIPFFKTLNWALKNKANCVLWNYALGLENGSVTMVTPKYDSFFRPGLTKIKQGENESINGKTFEVKMVMGSELLSKIPKIDYLKCDIEGYEEFVIPEIKEIIRQHKPIIQIEMGGGVKEKIEEILNEIGYSAYFVSKNKLLTIENNEFEPGDILYIPKEREVSILEELAA